MNDTNWTEELVAEFQEALKHWNGAPGLLWLAGRTSGAGEAEQRIKDLEMEVATMEYNEQEGQRVASAMMKSAEEEGARVERERVQAIVEVRIAELREMGASANELDECRKILSRISGATKP